MQKKRMLLYLLFCLFIQACQQSDDLEIPEIPKAEPYAEFTDYEYYSPESITALGSAYSKENKALKVSCLDLSDKTTIIPNPFSTWQSWGEVKSTSAILSDVCCVSLNKENYLSTVLGEKTKNYISNIKFNDHTFTYLTYSKGIKQRIVINLADAKINDEGLNLLKTNRTQFEEKYGSKFILSTTLGYTIFSIETYEVSPECQLSVEEVHKKINDLKSFGYSSEYLAKLEASLKIPGIKKYTYNYFSQEIDPKQNITTFKELTNYFNNMIVNSSDFYSVVSVELFPYENVLNYPKQ